MYFTSSAIYTLPYFKTTDQSALLICWIIPGMPYPIVEDPGGPESLLGTALQGVRAPRPLMIRRFVSHVQDSHYVLTQYDGTPAHFHHSQNPVVPSIGNGTFDEWVLNQEHQIIPSFIITFKKGVGQLMTDYKAAQSVQLKQQNQIQSKPPNPAVNQAPLSPPTIVAQAQHVLLEESSEDSSVVSTSEEEQSSDASLLQSQESDQAEVTLLPRRPKQKLRQLGPGWRNVPLKRGQRKPTKPTLK